MNIFISGQKYFGECVLRDVLSAGHNVVGVCCPIGDKYIGGLANINGINIVPSGSLNHEVFPDNVDLGITAHSFDYIGKKTRYKAKIGWIGYHPSLLPRHRGKSAIEWAIRMKDVVTGGSVYWLNGGIDRGDIERQEWIWLSHNKDAKDVWREELLPIGRKLIKSAVLDISKGIINKTPQNNVFSTFEPSLDNIRDIYKPDLLMLKHPANA